MWPLDPGPGHVAAVGILGAAATQSVLELDGTPLLDGFGDADAASS
jgi:hypothetical protein